MSAEAIYWIGDDLADLAVFWKDRTGALIDFSSGYTFVAKLSLAGSTTAGSYFSKSTGFTGAAGSLTTDTPNLVVAWSTTGELNSLTADGDYDIEIRATRTSDGKIRTLRKRRAVRINTVL